jgi:hypothetical protein
MLEETPLQIGDLAHSYSPFTGERHPALVIGERMCPHNGRLLILLVTPVGEDPRIDESPIEFVGPFNTSPRLQ